MLQATRWSASQFGAAVGSDVVGEADGQGSRGRQGEGGRPAVGEGGGRWAAGREAVLYKV